MLGNKSDIIPVTDPTGFARDRRELLSFAAISFGSWGGDGEVAFLRFGLVCAVDTIAS